MLYQSCDTFSVLPFGIELSNYQLDKPMPIDTTQLKMYELQLSKLNKTGLKIAFEGTLNDIAFETRKESVKTIKDKFITRNAFTTSGRNMSVDKAKRGKLTAEFGHTQKYMREQETGFMKQPDQSLGGVAIPTPVASGELSGMAEGTNVRRKVVRKANRRPKLKGALVTKRYKTLPSNQRTMALVKNSIKTKRKFIILGRSNLSIFKVTGTIKKFKLDRLYSLQTRAIPIKPTPWLKPSINEAYKKSDEFYFKRLGYQLDRLKKK